MMQKGLEINFYDMLRQIRKKWAVLLAFVLIFAVAADFYGYRKAALSADRERRALEEYAQSLGTTVDALPEHMTVELTELRSALTEEEASFVEAAAKLYMYRMWASDKINAELVVGEPDDGDLEIVQTLYYANEGVQSATQVMTSAEKSYYNVLVKGLSGTDMSVTEKEISSSTVLDLNFFVRFSQRRISAVFSSAISRPPGFCTARSQYFHLSSRSCLYWKSNRPFMVISS